MTLDPAYLATALASLVGVLALIVLLARGARRLGLDAGARPGRRLALVEALAVDHRRRLVLVRCDEAEHLLLLGGERDLVLQRTGRAAPPALSHGAAPAMVQEGRP